jgi:hypothetical protein
MPPLIAVSSVEAVFVLLAPLGAAELNRLAQDHLAPRDWIVAAYEDHRGDCCDFQGGKSGAGVRAGDGIG